ncbi:MAG: PD40 domain-containing protein [Armatimonadetes bacterium]|nr:PD40 domain-containing protein [Armatimonadota bacterium]MBS1710883.1 PD40 domain-containing protein [Armatimonadota bacterium]MBX3108555.1 PD40 domain-containing protein [Fimbriimonadaceae bacterium]
MKDQITKRFIIGALIIAALLISFNFIKSFVQDPDVGAYDSSGQIVAIEQTRDGGRLALFDEAGKRIDPPKPSKATYDDREVSWAVDGSRIFVSSNRETNAYNVYRWNPGDQKFMRRSKGTRSQGAPWFGPAGDPDAKNLGLLQTGGQIFELDVKTGDLGQILPPPGERISVGEEGAKGSMEGYDRFGTAFTKARYAGSKEMIYGLMRNDEGYTMVFQPVGVDAMGQPLRPIEMYRGQIVDFETDPNGVGAVLVRGFQFPPYQDVPKEFIKGGKVVKPFSSALFRVTIGPDGKPASEAVIVVGPDAPEAVGDFAISPDGLQIAVVVGAKTEGGGFEPAVMLVMPFKVNGGAEAKPVVQGRVSSPSWSGDGTKLAYLKQDGKDIDIYRVNADGSSETKVTSGGTWLSPRFSPAK